MPNENHSRGAGGTPRRLLHCDVCSHSVTCAATDLLRYTRDGWPRCCGQVMALFTEAGPSGAGDTKTGRPPLP